MLDRFKKLTETVKAPSVKPGEKMRLCNEAAAAIEDEVHEISEQLENVPENRLPNVKIMRSIRLLRERVNTILAPVGLRNRDIPEGEEIVRLVVEFKRLTLERYEKLIANSMELTPFATFSELYKASVGETGEPFEQLASAYQKALIALFSHPAFESTLLGRMDKKIEMMSRASTDRSDQERMKVELFLKHYEVNKNLNPKLSENDLLEMKMAELEAVLFFKEQTEILEGGNFMASDELVEYITYWTDFLSGLSEEEQRVRMPLIEVVNRCSQANNKVLEAME